MKPHKQVKERTRLTVGGNLLDFTGNLSTPTASVTTAKCVINSVISTPKAKCLTADIQHFYLNNDLPDLEYMRLPITITPQDFIEAYKLTTLVDNQGWVYFRIDKGMYGLKQAGIIANEALVKHMTPFGYHPTHTWTMGPRHKAYYFQPCR